MSGCSDESPPLLVEGIRQFNAGAYFECHETLETLWMGELAAVRELYQGILQVGVALYKWERNQYPGAVRLLQSGVAHLVPFAPTCQGVDVAGLIAAARGLCTRIEALGPDRMHELPRAMLPQVAWVSR